MSTYGSNETRHHLSTNVPFWRNEAQWWFWRGPNIRKCNAMGVGVISPAATKVPVVCVYTLLTECAKPLTTWAHFVSRSAALWWPFCTHYITHCSHNRHNSHAQLRVQLCNAYAYQDVYPYIVIFTKMAAKSSASEGKACSHCWHLRTFREVGIYTNCKDFGYR